MLFAVHHIFTLVSFVIYTYNFATANINDSSYCKISRLSNKFGELFLGPEVATISDQVFHLCPENITHLTIREILPTVDRRISNSFLSSDVLLHMLHLTINITHLSFDSTIGNPNQFSRIRFLFISGCGIKYLPLGVLRGLVDLESVDVSGNLLVGVPPDLIMYTPRLVSINLSRNQLKYLPKLTSTIFMHNEKLAIDVSNNPLDCDDCVNSWLSKQVEFNGTAACSPWRPPCNPAMSSRVESESAVESHNDSSSFPILRGKSLVLNCSVTSYMMTNMFWVSPIGVLPVPNSMDINNTMVYSYIIQPILAPTIVRITRLSTSASVLSIINLRGHLSGDWFCVARSPIDLTVSSPLRVQIRSSFYYRDVYLISLYYGYGAMVVLLLIGIIGGTIRYCSETHCMRRPQPAYNYKGKTFMGVIPVPGIEEDSVSDKQDDASALYDIDEGSFQYVSSGGLCKMCSKPPTYWFCMDCKAVHFAETVRNFKDYPPFAAGGIPAGLLGEDGEIMLTDIQAPSSKFTVHSQSKVHVEQRGSIEVHQPLMKTSDAVRRTNPCDGDAIVPTAFIYVASGRCVIKVRCPPPKASSSTEIEGYNNVNVVLNAICCHHKHRPGNADVKLVVSNEKLAEEYRDALADLARAVESPDPAHFRETLEEFRGRLRCDVGNGVKVLRGEFQGLRAKSARGVATLKIQSSAAAQRVRAGFTHGVEQVKGGMRSVAELCGASSSIGQTISVVSVYVDETDQVRKERFISNFVF